MAMLAADFGPGGRGRSVAGRARLPRERAGRRGSASRHGGTTRTIEAGGEPPLEGVATAEGGAVLVFADGQAFAFSLPGVGGARGGGDALDGDVESPMRGG